MSRYNLLRWNGTRVVDDRGVGLVEVGCGLGAFLGHEMSRFAASCTPKCMKLLIFLYQRKHSKSVGPSRPCGFDSRSRHHPGVGLRISFQFG